MNSKFEFWLKNEKEQVFLLLPVTPKTYDITYGQKIEVVNATAVGDLNIAGHKDPIALSVESFFPSLNNEYEFINKGDITMYTPLEYVNKIKQWVDDKEVVRFIITDNTGSKLNTLFYIESLRYWEDNESNGDINYILSLKEYRAMNVVKAVAVKTESAVRTTNNPPTPPESYTVVKGDTLSGISRKFYGTPNRYMDIYNANKGIIGGNPNLIFPGQKYEIPR